MKPGGWYRRRRYAVLFFTLLFTIAFVPMMNAVCPQLSLVKALLVANLFAAAMSTVRKRMRRNLGLAAVGVFILVYPLERLMGLHLFAGGLGLWSVAAAIAAWGAVVYAMRARRVDSEHLFAALSAYLLAGMIFGAVHYVLERAIPGSYATFGEPLTRPFDIYEASYFSFVTMATLGYGDIVPISPSARSISIVEAIIGQLYLAVMIARIVSVYVPGRRPGRGKRFARRPTAEPDDGKP